MLVNTQFYLQQTLTCLIQASIEEVMIIQT